MGAYYNEIDPFAAQWLRNLIAAGHIAPGEVDERDIRDVRPADIAGFDQCHFFAGIGGWSLALRLAGWPDDRPVWTGSCPCQPFSAAGKGKAADDERHLWPAWFPLIAERSPPVVFGEQVEAAIGWGWLDAVFADLEGQGYACGAADLSAAGVGAPHIRQRLWWVADAMRGRAEYGPRESLGEKTEAHDEDRGVSRERLRIGVKGAVGELADDTSGGRGQGDEDARGGGQGTAAPQERGGPSERGASGELGDADDARSQGRLVGRDGADQRPSGQAGLDGGLEHATREQVGIPRRPWIDGGTDWLPCRDGKARPVEPGTFPLAHGIPGRVGRLRAYGNAIVPQVAAEFIIAAASSL